MTAVLKIMALVRAQGGSFSPKPIFTILAPHPPRRKKKEKQKPGGLETMNRKDNVQERGHARVRKEKTECVRTWRGSFSLCTPHTTPPNNGVPWGEAVFASLLTPPLEKKRTEMMAHVLVLVCPQHYTNSRFFSLFPPLYTISPPGAAGRESSSS